MKLLFRLFKAYRLYIILAAAFAALAGGTYIYIQHLQHENSKLLQNNIILQQSVDTQKDVIEGIQKNVKEIQSENKKLEEVRARNKKLAQDNARKFSRNGKTLGALALAKPEILENLVNKGSKERLRCLEIATGAPKDETDFTNSLCPTDS